MTITQQIKIIFQEGLPGFPDCRNFILADLKREAYAPLKILLSEDKAGINFILYPHVNGHTLLDEADLQELKELSGANQNQYYSIVTVKEPNGHFSITANLRAPIVIDQTNGIGWQHVLNKADQYFQVPLDELSQTLRQRRKAL